MRYRIEYKYGPDSLVANLAQVDWLINRWPRCVIEVWDHTTSRNVLVERLIAIELTGVTS